MAIVFNYDESESKREVIKPGEYEGEITSARLGISSAGNDMLVLGIQPEGSSMSIRDHIVFSPKAKWKARQFFLCRVIVFTEPFRHGFYDCFLVLPLPPR